MKRQVGSGALVADTVWNSKSTQLCRRHPLGGGQMFSVVWRGGTLISCVDQFHFPWLETLPEIYLQNPRWQTSTSSGLFLGAGEHWEI